MPNAKKSSHKNDQEEFVEESHEKKGKKGGTAQATGPNVVGAAMVGAIAGAAFGVAASIALSDEKTRQKAAEFIGDVRDKAADRISQITKGAKQTATKAVDAIPETMKEQPKKVVEDRNGSKAD